MGETEESGGSRAVYHNANQLADGTGSRLFNVVDPDRKHGRGGFFPFRPSQESKNNKACISVWMTMMGGNQGGQLKH